MRITIDTEFSKPKIELMSEDEAIECGIDAFDAITRSDIRNYLKRHPDHKVYLTHLKEVLEDALG